MTFYVENETEFSLSDDIISSAEAVVKEILKQEKCPCEAEVNLQVTDNFGIREINKEFRDIDSETDVLSFPMVQYESPSDFSILEDEEQFVDFFNPETQELMLGDIVISYEKAMSQAQEFGHSFKREFCFLVAHSMFHLIGYDHMTEEEAAIMEDKQEAILQKLQITRD